MTSSPDSYVWHQLASLPLSKENRDSASSERQQRDADLDDEQLEISHLLPLEQTEE